MSARPLAAWGLLVGVVVLGAPVWDARGEPPPPRTDAYPGPPGAQEHPSSAHGAVVVSLDADSARAARALARSVYRDAALRPNLDDASARALIGEPLAEDAPPAARELAEVRGSLLAADVDAVSRRLLVSLGVEAGAALVIAVSTVAGRPVARVLRVSTSTYVPIELGATITGPPALPSAAPQPSPPAATAGDSSPGAPPAPPHAAASYDWPGATDVLRGLLPGNNGGVERRSGLPPVVDKVATPQAAADHDGAGGPIWSSPWFWGALGGVAAVGVTVFVLSQSTMGDSDVVHLQGHIAP